MRHAMPDEWRCVLAVPAAEPGLSGGAETAAFASLRPEPERSALISQLVLTALLPALVERDLEEFGAALSRIQRLVGDAFAPVQGGTFHPQAAPLVDALLRLGAAGAGQSSWGPAVYGVVGSEAEGRDRAPARGRARRGRASGGGALRQRAARAWRRSHEAAGERDRRRRGAAGRRRRRRRRRRQEPRRGVAGRSGAGGDRAGARACVPAELPLSAAIGDLPALPGTAALAALGAARSGAAYVKIGLWGSSTTEEAVAVLRAARDAVDGDAAVVAATYADAARVPSRPLPPRLLVDGGAPSPASPAA